jgi:hypothetical protein
MISSWIVRLIVVASMQEVARRLGEQDVKALSCMAASCKVWNECVNAVKTFGTVEMCVSNTNRDAALAWLHHYTDKISSLNLTVSTDVDTGLTPFILAVSGPMLKSLTLTNTEVYTDVFSGEYEWKLEVLEVEDCILNEDFLGEIADAFSDCLRVLIVDNVDLNGLQSSFMTNEWTYLETLTFSNCGYVYHDIDVYHGAYHNSNGDFPLLRELQFKDCWMPFIVALSLGIYPVLEKVIISRNSMPECIEVLLTFNIPNLDVFVCEDCELNQNDIKRIKAKWPDVLIEL